MKRPSSLFALGVSGLLALGPLGCASAAVRHAEAGDQTQLRAELAGKHARGKLTNGEARDVARALLTREVERLPADAAGVRRVESLRACAKDLEAALSRRAERHDVVGAAAAKVLVQEGLTSPGAAADYGTDPDPAYRALASRALVGADDGEARARALLAPESVGREMAALAAGDGATLAELDGLFEVARLDPDAGVKHLALRAAVAAVGRKHRVVLAGLASSADPSERAATAAGRHALDRLRDAWTVADKGLRDDIASGFAVTPLYELGGREALQSRLAEGGPDRLVVASALLRRGAPPKDAEDGFLRENAERAARVALRDGSTLERTFAAMLVAPRGEGLEALKLSARDADREVAVTALGRLLQVPSEAGAARVELVRAAGPKDDATLAPRARGLLAGAGYLAVQLWLEEQAVRPGLQLRAAAGLAALGRVARAAPLLTDPDADVRTRAACLVLTATR